MPSAEDNAGLEDVPPVASSAANGANPNAAAVKKNLMTVGLLVGAASAIAALVLTNFKDSTVYAKGVDQLLADKGHWVGRSVRVEGTLVRGTLKFREKPCEYEMDVSRGTAKVHLRYASCVKPDTLRDDMPDVGVTAEGRLQDGGEFIATNVLAKCPSKYEMKDGKRVGPMPEGPPGSTPSPPPAQLQ
ncbi:MAG: cytochrome c maturation protein CcmE [Polyangiales bacterium]